MRYSLSRGHVRLPRKGRTSFLRILGICTAILMVLAAGYALAIRLKAHADGGVMTPVTDETVPLVPQAQKVGTVDPNQMMDLTISLNPRNQDALDQYVQQVNTPGSPVYHQYLTPDQFKAQFAPTDDEVQQVKDALQAQGLQTTDVSSDNTLLHVQGTANTVQQAFQTQLDMYQDNGQTFYANDSAPKVPAAILPDVSDISGLTDSDQPVPMSVKPLRPPQSGASQQSPVGGFTPDQLNQAYDMTPLKQAGEMGDGQTIALVEYGGYKMQDVQTYFKQFNLTPKLQNILLDGADGKAVDDAAEVELDIEAAAAAAPHATIMVYEIPWKNQKPNFELDLYNRILKDNQAKVVSESFGLCEPQASKAEMKALDHILEQGVAQGITFFAASGDDGSNDCQAKPPTVTVDFPASATHMTAVGGTTLSLNPRTESGWSGSGGGVSTVFKQAAWQKGPGTTASGMKQVPDVSAVADPDTGYAVYCTVTADSTCTANGKVGGKPLGWTVIGGTSGASPLWAGMTAVLDQHWAAKGITVGNMGQEVYQLLGQQAAAPPFNDITSGSNGKFSAGAGYDMVTGVGTPDINNIATDVGNGTQQQPDAANVTPTPDANATATPAAPDGGMQPPDATPPPDGGTQPPDATPPDPNAPDGGTQPPDPNVPTPDGGAQPGGI